MLGKVFFRFLISSKFVGFVFLIPVLREEIRDYTIQFQPPGPSHRTMVALRWLHYPEAQVEDWYAHLRGERDDLGGANEGRVNKTLQSLYHALALEAQTKLDDLVKRKKVDGCELRDGLRKLLQDELKILLMLIGSES